MGAVLSQRDDDGLEHPIAYMSKKCVGKERHYSARRGEAVAIRRALRKWRCFLEGQHFVIETDHRPLEFLRREHNDAQLNRIWEALECFHYTLRYKPGAANQNANALSRLHEYTHEAGDPLREGGVETDDGQDLDDDEDVVDSGWAVNSASRQEEESVVTELRQRQRVDPLWSDIIEGIEKGKRGNHEETGDNHRRNQDEAAGVDDNSAGAGASRDGAASDSAIPSLDADDGDFEPYNPADFKTSDDESDRDETYAQASASSRPRDEHTGPRRSVRFACIGLRGVYGDGP